MVNQLEAIIFDFGAVILDIDYKATEDAFAKLFPAKVLPLYSKTDQRPLFDDLETGRIAADHFLTVLQSWALPGVSIEAITQAWNAILLDTKPERLAFLRSMKQRYRTFLLSNTNSIHKQSFDLILRRHLGSTSFDSLFEQAYYSHLLGLRKPDPLAFETIIERHGLRRAHTLFIDDSLQHIESAKRLGLKTHHLQGDLLSDKVLMEMLCA